MLSFCKYSASYMHIIPNNSCCFKFRRSVDTILLFSSKFKIFLSASLYSNRKSGQLSPSSSSVSSAALNSPIGTLYNSDNFCNRSLLIPPVFSQFCTATLETPMCSATCSCVSPASFLALLMYFVNAFI